MAWWRRERRGVDRVGTEAATACARLDCMRDPARARTNSKPHPLETPLNDFEGPHVYRINLVATQGMHRRMCRSNITETREVRVLATRAVWTAETEY